MDNNAFKIPIMRSITLRYLKNYKEKSILVMNLNRFRHKKLFMVMKTNKHIKKEFKMILIIQIKIHLF